MVTLSQPRKACDGEMKVYRCLFKSCERSNDSGHCSHWKGREGEAGYIALDDGGDIAVEGPFEYVLA